MVDEKLSLDDICANFTNEEMEMEKDCRKYLLAVARTYGKAEKLALSTVSRRFHGADHFLDAFERGDVTVTLRKYDEMISAFKKDWPERAKWPEGTIQLNRNCVKNGSESASARTKKRRIS